MSINTDKGNNPSNGCDDYKHIYNKCQCTQFHKTSTTGHKSIGRSKHNKSG
jgi:hypothetical protein